MKKKKTEHNLMASRIIKSEQSEPTAGSQVNIFEYLIRTPNSAIDVPFVQFNRNITDAMGCVTQNSATLKSHIIYTKRLSNGVIS